jgi:hypothetical protein
MTNALLILFTIWALFSDDIKMLSTTNDADPGFSIAIIIIQFFFFLEIIICSLCIERYFLGFFFWLDLISVVSLLLDIHWIYEIIIDQLQLNYKNQIGSHTRTAKMGSRAIKILRVVRLIRIVRITKIYKLTENLKNENDNDLGTSEHSKVGKKLSEATMRRVIILVLAMILGIIIFNPNFYFNEITSIEFGIRMFNDYSSIDDNGLKVIFDNYITSHNNSTCPILYLSVPNFTYGNPNYSLLLRDDEKIEVVDDCSNLISNNSNLDPRCYALFDNRIESRLTAELNIAKTLMVGLILFLGSFCFSNESNTYVLQPLDSMIKKLKKISKNPMRGMQEIEIEEYFEILKQLELKNKNYLCSCSQTNDYSKDVETIILDKTIVKIGSLLSMAYGESGSKFIEKYLQDDGPNMELYNNSPGEKIYGIYCFLNLIYYKDIIDSLKDQYSVLLNLIFEVISEITLDYGVYTIKNLGDGILLVWKINENNSQNDLQIQRIVDMAIICIIKILMEIQKSPSIENVSFSNLIF